MEALKRRILLGDYMIPGRIRNAFSQQALWNIRARVYAESSKKRGLWLTDLSRCGEIVEIVTAKTGRACPGNVDSYYGDFEPPYLSATATHRLYGCSDGGHLFMVYPPDAEEVHIAEA
jgi:hypothetical protein